METEAMDRREIEIVRVYAAPRDLVFSMWTEAEHLARWWGPDGFSVLRAESDPRPGGELLIVMSGLGFNQEMRARYREVVKPERIVVDATVRGPHGTVMIESSHSADFEDLGGSTQVTLRARARVFVPEARSALEGMRAGWNQTLQRLQDAISGEDQRQVVLVRLFDLPPEAVFRHWAEPGLLIRWWSESDSQMPVYREVVRHSRLVYESAATPSAGHGYLGTVTFDEMANKTALALRLVFDSPQERDRAVQEQAAVQAAEHRLNRLAESLPKPRASGAP